MKRRDFIKTTGIALASIALPVTGAKAASKKPNIIYILADDLGYGELGCYGQKLIKTRNIDSIAANGIKLTQHYSGSALCAPSRCSFITGKHTGHTFIRNNKPLPYEGNLPIPKDEVTIAEVLKKAGYATACVGKWGLGFPGSEGDPNNQGFDHWFGYNCQRQAHNYYPDHLWRNADKVMLPGNADGKQEQYSHDLLTSEALGFIQKNKTNPFFLYLPYTIPHTKFQVPDIGDYAEENWTRDQKIQAAMITRMDGDIGKMIELLKQLGLEDNTLLIFTSDNGPHGASGTLMKFKAAGVLKAKKSSLHEGGIRVPFVAQWPNKIKAGTESGHACAFWDMLPTFADIAKAKKPRGIDGISFLPALTGSKRQKKHKYLYWELDSQQALIKGDMKLIRYWNKKTKKISTRELYNLADDISENMNIVHEKPEIAAELEKLMDSARVNSSEFKTLYDTP